MPLSLRQCRSTELDKLIEISRKTFVDAFETDNNPEDFRNYIDSAFKKDTLLAELENHDTTFYFVHQDKDLVGYLKLNEKDAQSDIKSEEGIELERIYVLQDFQGRRIGEWMLNEVKKIASSKKKGFLWLGVWENNQKAIRFYEKYGFSKFGTHPYYVGKDKQTDWLMRFDLKAKI